MTKQEILGAAIALTLMDERSSYPCIVGVWVIYSLRGKK